jgi:ACS family hexuronate transporter-like MFS transporter
VTRFITDAPWWFYLAWMPKFLIDKFGLTPYAMATSVAIIYLVADFGAIGGGWISSSLLKRGWSVNGARKTGLLCAALGAVPIMLVALLEGVRFGSVSAVWLAVPLVALAASSHQAWSSNMFTIVSDTLPKSAVAMTVGIGTAFGSVGSSLFQFVIALSVIKTGGYAIPFFLAGSLYLIGLLVLHLFLPKLEVAQIDQSTRPRVNWATVIAACVVMVAALIGLQAWLNKPAFSSLDHYYLKRATELKATGHEPGPDAKVGWHDARWVKWTMPDGATRLELIKFDRDGRPMIEPKGAAANKYSGPTLSEVQASAPP